MSPLETWLATACLRHRVPGASVALWLEGTVQQAVAGWAVLEPARPVTPATRFRYGSITKLLTATTVLQWVDRGTLTLDAAVRQYCPAFRTRDPARSARVTSRHLLQHRGGFFGDLYEPTGEGVDAWGRYVALLADVEHPLDPGEVASYSNAGYVLLAHLTETLAGEPWDQTVRHQLLEPLGMASVELVPTWPPEAAEGYRVDGAGWVPWREDEPLKSLAPAGSMAIGTAADLLVLARTLCQDGVGPDGARALSPALAQSQREQCLESPSPSFAMAWGLGVMQFDVAGRLFGHDGAVPGQNAFLRYVPDTGFAVVLLTNGGDGRALCQELLEHLADERPALPRPPRFAAVAGDGSALVVDAYVGEFRNARYRITVAARPGGLQLRFEPGQDARDLSEVIECALDPMQPGPRPELFVASAPGSRLPTTHRFSRFDGGRARLLHFRGRVFQRVA